MAMAYSFPPWKEVEDFISRFVQRYGTQDNPLDYSQILGEARRNFPQYPIPEVDATINWVLNDLIDLDFKGYEHGPVHMTQILIDTPAYYWHGYVADMVA